MHDIEQFDPTLAGEWPGSPVYGGGLGWSDEECRRQVEIYALETKAGSPEEALRLLLNDLTVEMRDEFKYFRELRMAAEAAGQAGGGNGGNDVDEAAAKLARVDIKTAVDAMSLIARTLEKIDSLQRQLARDREAEAERRTDGAAYEDNKRRLLAIIEQRAEERAHAILAERDLCRATDAVADGGTNAAAGRSGTETGAAGAAEAATGPP